MRFLVNCFHNLENAGPIPVAATKLNNMKIITIILISIVALGSIFLVLWTFRNKRKYNQFQEKMKIGDLCRVYYGEKKFFGTIKPNQIGDIGKLFVKVDFSETEDFPLDNNGHKILSKNYLKEDIYPI